MKEKAALELARRLHGYHQTEREKLDVIRRYYKGVQARPMAIPKASPREVIVMARSARVNVMPIVVNSLVQSMYVDGFRSREESENSVVWDAWQANQMDARQLAVNRATFQFGVSYIAVLPARDGEAYPRMVPLSPRHLTVLYGEDHMWPIAALEKLDNGLWRLYDESAYYLIQLSDSLDRRRGIDSRDDDVIDVDEHEFGVTPVVRYVDEEDLDAEDDVEPEEYGPAEVSPVLRGQVAPLMPIQDQIDLTTFGLHVAQHYGAFRQRYIIGWTAESEEKALKAAASKVWTFDKNPDDVKLGEFEQTRIDGYIESREASLRHAATLSQTPAHELTGQLIQMSAEALAAAEAGKDRKVEERQATVGESHEQTLQLVGRAMGVEVANDAQVIWRDTSARSFAATVDALGKAAQLLEVPPEELWERIPGVTQQDVERWRRGRSEGSAFDRLAGILERQSNPAAAPVAA